MLHLYPYFNYYPSTCTRNREKVCNMFDFKFKHCDYTHRHHLPFPPRHLAEPLQEDVALVSSICWCLQVAAPFCPYLQWTAVVIQCLVLASQVTPLFLTDQGNGCIASQYTRIEEPKVNHRSLVLSQFAGNQHHWGSVAGAVSGENP